MGRYREPFSKHSFNETMGVHESYKETFTSWAETTNVTKMRGRDHLGGYRIGHGERDNIKLQFFKIDTMGKVDMSARLQARLVARPQDSKRTTEQSDQQMDL